MKAESQILNNYFGILDNLSPELKLAIIERLSKSLKSEISQKKDKMEKAFGAWEDSKNTEEMITEIRNNRTFNRKLESF